MITCSNCGFANPPDVNFCTRCGNPLRANATMPMSGVHQAPQAPAQPTQQLPPTPPPTQPPPRFATPQPLPQHVPPPQYAPQQPYGPAPQYPMPAPRRTSGCGSAILAALLVLVVVLGGGYALLRTHVLPAQQLLKFTGAGTGDISVANLTQDSFTVTLEPNASASIPSESRIMGPMDVEGFYKLQPGRYTLTVPRPSAGGGSCDLSVDVGGAYNVMIAPNAVYISVNSNTVQTGTELNFASSALCH